jgi:methylated-DNA-[protein]-cysteine S-methyltransferase
MNIRFRQTAIGLIGIAEQGGALSGLFFGSVSVPKGDGASSIPLLDEAFSQLDAWLDGQVRSFTLPLAPAGTAFQQRVWAALSGIPYGCTASYREVAESVGSPDSARAVGGACGRNPLPIFIPCHRVLCSDGGIGGYLGGPDIKMSLLDLERRSRA